MIFTQAKGVFFLNHIQFFDKEQFSVLVKESGLVIESHTTWGFYWTMWMSIFWAVGQGVGEEETINLVKSDKFDNALLQWTGLWNTLLKNPKAALMMESFDQTLPKAQAIIARKPL